MGHYDECREGYCPKCGAGPGNIKHDRRSGIARCEYCGTEVGGTATGRLTIKRVPDEVYQAFEKWWLKDHESTDPGFVLAFDAWRAGWEAKAATRKAVAWVHGFEFRLNEPWLANVSFVHQEHWTDEYWKPLYE